MTKSKQHGKKNRSFLLFFFFFIFVSFYKVTIRAIDIPPPHLFLITIGTIPQSLQQSGGSRLHIDEECVCLPAWLFLRSFISYTKQKEEEICF